MTFKTLRNNLYYLTIFSESSIFLYTVLCDWCSYIFNKETEDQNIQFDQLSAEQAQPQVLFVFTWNPVLWPICCPKYRHRCHTENITVPNFLALMPFSCYYHKIWSCFYIFLGPGGMGPHSPLQTHSRLPFIPWISQHQTPPSSNSQGPYYHRSFAQPFPLP